MAGKNKGQEPCKALICGYGEWSAAHLPIANAQILPENVADHPSVWFTVSCLKAAGIQTFILAATPENASRYQDVLGDGSGFDARVSYLLMDDDGNLAQALSVGGEFIAQSDVVIASAGFCGAGPDFDAELRKAVRENPGAMIVAADGVATCSDVLSSGVVIADRRCHQIARRIMADRGGDAGLTDILDAYKSLNAFAAMPLKTKGFNVCNANADQLRRLRRSDTD